MREFHGMRKTKIYRVWTDMKNRCNSKSNKQYRDYGGRGIKVCQEWENSFSKFYEDMGNIPFIGAQLDRKDVNCGYSKENCRWATRSLNMSNRRGIKRNLPKGVVINKKNGKIFSYRASIMIEKINYILGFFKTVEDAGKAYIEIYKEWYGV